VSSSRESFLQRFENLLVDFRGDSGPLAVLPTMLGKARELLGAHESIPGLLEYKPSLLNRKLDAQVPYPFGAQSRDGDEVVDPPGPYVARITVLRGQLVHGSDLDPRLLVAPFLIYIAALRSDDAVGRVVHWVQFHKHQLA